MTDQNPSMHLTVEETAQNLAAFAVDRTDLKTILHSLPPESGPNRVTLEYELGMLKILTVGWGISFFMPVSDKNKPLLSEAFWQMIQESLEIFPHLRKPRPVSPLIISRSSRNG